MRMRTTLRCRFTYQTSCLCPATLAAGLNGFSRRNVADIARRGATIARRFGATAECLEVGPSAVDASLEAECTRLLISVCAKSDHAQRVQKSARGHDCVLATMSELQLRPKLRRTPSPAAARAQDHNRRSSCCANCMLLNDGSFYTL
jgi:hypothetical protein